MIAALYLALGLVLALVLIGWAALIIGCVNARTARHTQYKLHSWWLRQQVERRIRQIQHRQEQNHG